MEGSVSVNQRESSTNCISNIPLKATSPTLAVIKLANVGGWAPSPCSSSIRNFQPSEIKLLLKRFEKHLTQQITGRCISAKGRLICLYTLAYLEKRPLSSNCQWSLLSWRQDWCSKGIRLTNVEWEREGRGKKKKKEENEKSNLTSCGFMWAQATTQERKKCEISSFQCLLV